MIIVIFPSFWHRKEEEKKRRGEEEKKRRREEEKRRKEKTNVGEVNVKQMDGNKETDHAKKGGLSQRQNIDQTFSLIHHHFVSLFSPSIICSMEKRERKKREEKREGRKRKRRRKPRDRSKDVANDRVNERRNGKTIKQENSQRERGEKKSLSADQR